MPDFFPWSHVGLVLQLVILEGLLSFDNALALAVLVKSRLKDPAEQKKALTWGIWGAYVFRVGIIFIGVWLMKNEWIKLLAGLYLVWLAISHLFLKKEDDVVSAVVEGQKSRQFWKLTPLWGTILSVELMDIMFSIDSIGVALAISDVKWVLIAGAVLGILTMRIAAGVFVGLVEKFPILEKTAFLLVGIAGVNVILKVKDLPLGSRSFTIDYAMGEHMFLGVMVGILVGSLLLNYFFPKYFEKKSDSSLV